MRFGEPQGLGDVLNTVAQARHTFEKTGVDCQALVRAHAEMLDLTPPVAGRLIKVSSTKPFPN